MSPVPVIGCGPQTAAVRLDNRPADGQAHAAALRFGREEGVENLLGFLRW